MPAAAGVAAGDGAGGRRLGPGRGQRRVDGPGGSGGGGAQFGVGAGVKAPGGPGGGWPTLGERCRPRGHRAHERGAGATGGAERAETQWCCSTVCVCERRRARCWCPRGCSGEVASGVRSRGGGHSPGRVTRLWSGETRSRGRACRRRKAHRSLLSETCVELEPSEESPWVFLPLRLPSGLGSSSGSTRLESDSSGFRWCVSKGK